VAHRHDADPAALPGRRHERGRWGGEQVQPHGQLPGGGGGARPVGGLDLGGPLERPGDQAAVDLGTDGVELEAEAGDHPQVAAPAPQPPEQVRVAGAAGRADLAVGGDDLGLDQVADRPPEAAGQVAEAAAQGQAAHPDLGDEAERVARPWAWVARSRSASRQPGPTWARAASGAPGSSRMPDRSTSSPPSAMAVPAMWWPPPLTPRARPWSRAKPTPAATSAAERGCRTSVGVRVTMPFQSRTASSQPG